MAEKALDAETEAQLIPLQAEARSLNIATTGAVALPVVALISAAALAIVGKDTAATIAVVTAAVAGGPQIIAAVRGPRTPTQTQRPQSKKTGRSQKDEPKGNNVAANKARVGDQKEPTNRS